MTKNILINGPFNVVRLEGLAFGIKKIIYVMFDYHLDIQFQTKCPSFESLDLSQYLATTLKNVKKPIDFMFEITKTEVDRNSPQQYKEKYIREVSSFFKIEHFKSINTAPSMARYHYIDIRDHLYNTVDYYMSILEDRFKLLNSNNYLSVNNINEIVYNLNLLTKELNLWDKILFGDIHNNSKIIKKHFHELQKKKLMDNKIAEENIQKLTKFITKLRTRYNNPVIFKNLEGIFDLIKKYSDESKKICFDIINEFNDNKKFMVQYDELVYVESLNQYMWGQSMEINFNIIKSVCAKYNTLYVYVLKLFSNIVDTFFLRRLLDKKYIQHVITYTGCAHSINYIQHLLTKYDFQITHVSYSLLDNITDINDHLKKYNDTNDRREYEKMFYPPKLIQCSDLSSFPSNFN